jgi:hypothetical protein
MADTLKLHLIKTGINLMTLVASKVLPRTYAKYPQTRILLRTFARLTKAFRTEMRAKRRGLEDENFKRLLDVTLRALAYISEEDRYYRQWLGLLFLLVEEEVDREREKIGRDEFIRLVKEQWLLDWRVIPEGVFQNQRRELFTVLLTDFLHNLT